jgi:hypothetical protein
VFGVFDCIAPERVYWLQREFTKVHKARPMPLGLRLDPILTPSSTFLVSLEGDKKQFAVQGELFVPEFVFTEAEKEFFKQEREHNREKQLQMTKDLFLHED